MTKKVDYAVHYATVNKTDETSIRKHIEYSTQYAQLAFDQGACLDDPILDIGCGWGMLCQAMSKFGFSNVLGIDQSQGQVDQALRLGAKNIQYIEDTPTFLAEHQNAFTTIFFMDVLEHINPQYHVDVLNGIYNALKPNGTAIVKVPNAYSNIALKYRYMDYEHTTLFTQESLTAISTFAGFEPENIQIIEEFYYPQNPKLISKGQLSLLYYKTLRHVFRTLLRLKMASECGHEIAGSAILSPNIVAILKK